MEHGDFLTFDCDGDHIFDFTLYWGFRNGWTKKEIRSSNFVVEEEDEDSDRKNEEYKEGEEVPDKEKLEAGVSRNKTRKGKCKNSISLFLSPQYLMNSSLLELDDSQEKAVVKDKVEHKRIRKVGDDDVFEYGIVPRPNNPYFVAKIRETKKNELHVPHDVLKDHNIKLAQTIILLNEQGREWTTNVRVWEDGRTWLTKWWKAFCKWNNFKPEDRCICKFKQEKGKQFILEMGILRAGSWLPKKKSQKGLDH
ncbi:putative B3 domain-containing protein At5g66980 [Diospyros lotus]|uniref:putative B3 domain-containing protein At5g66980 n=1 Tax=Diospyros lotus TaxID=55363 RepID=UPI0022506E40|nr:putative B3 domain-containing protein At5g66980 [Diospyros lotus]